MSSGWLRLTSYYMPTSSLAIQMTACTGIDSIDSRIWYSGFPHKLLHRVDSLTKDVCLVAWLLYWTSCSTNSPISGDLISHGAQVTSLSCQGQALNYHRYVWISEISGNVNGVILKKVSSLSTLRVFWQLPLQSVKTISSIFDISVSLMYNGIWGT